MHKRLNQPWLDEAIRLGIAEPEDYVNVTPVRYGWRDALDLVGLFAFFILVGML
jgi:hypothetical protein